MNVVRVNAVVEEHGDASLAAISEPQEVGGYLLKVVEKNDIHVVAEASAKAICDRDTNWTTRLVTYIVNQAQTGDSRACALVAFWDSYVPPLRDLIRGIVNGGEEIARFSEHAIRAGVWIGIQLAIMQSLAGTTELHRIEQQLNMLTNYVCQSGDFFIARLAEMGWIVHAAARNEIAKEVTSTCEPLKSRIRNLVEARKREQHVSADSIAAKDSHIAALTASLASCEKERDVLVKTCEGMTSTSLNAEKQLLESKVGELTASVSSIQAELDKARFDTQYERLAREEAEAEVAQLKKLLIRNGINPYSSGADLGQAA